MRLVPSILLSSLALVLSGCGSVTYERARFDGEHVSNPTLGRGVYYELPASYSVLNPRSPVPTKRENAAFESYLRAITAANDGAPDHAAFREAILFRSENRYLWIYHASLNMPTTFRSMHPAQRTYVMPQIASSSYRYFDVPQSDFDYTFEQLRGRTAISYKPFRLGGGGVGTADWRGIGFTILGDVTDVIDIKIFARTEDLPAAQADLQSILDHFSYGSPKP